MPCPVHAQQVTAVESQTWLHGGSRLAAQQQHLLGWGWDSQSRLCSLVFAKVVQRRLGPKGTTRPLLRKEGWRAFSSILSTVPEPSKHNTPPASPAAALLWPGPFPLEFWLCSQLRPFFLPTSPPVSCLTPLGRPKLPSIGMWLSSHSSGGGGGEHAHNPQLLITNLWRQTGSWRQRVEGEISGLVEGSQIGLCNNQDCWSLTWC